MTARKVTVLECDACGTLLSTMEPHADRARARGRERGWAHVFGPLKSGVKSARASFDYCPDHAHLVDTHKTGSKSDD